MRIHPAQGGAEEHWDPAWWHGLLEWGGPALLAVLVFAVVARAVARRRRYRAVDVLTPADLEAAHVALRAAEQKTVGEIVPMVMERADAHPDVVWRVAVAGALAGSLLLAAWLPWHQPHWLLACQLGLGVLAGLLARLLPDVQRAVVSEARATEVAEEQAFQEFHRLGLPATAGRTGVLLFVSLFERRVVVLADEGIDGKVDGRTVWSAAKDAVLAGLARGSLRDGLIAGIERVGEVLATHAPTAAGDRNELPDRIVVQGRGGPEGT